MYTGGNAVHVCNAILIVTVRNSYHIYVHISNFKISKNFKKRRNVGINLTIILFCLKRPSDDVKYIGYNRRPILICLFQTKSKKRHFH